jgi:phosphoribosylformylglycinamidine synthase subunit PurS
MITAKIYITLKKSISDPQGAALKGALNSMGYDEVADVRIGKLVQIKLGKERNEETERKIKEMCQKLLSNPVIEDFTFEILEG